MEPDLALLERWRAGDRSAGNELFERHFDGIRRFFQYKVGNDADDLAQRTFTACLAARDQFRAQSSFRTYLFTIARHELYSHLRGLRRAGDMDFGITSIVDVVTSPSSRIGRQQEAGRLREALATLPVEQQLLLELHYWHDHDAAALAEIFSLDPGAIRVRLTRARQALRTRLAEGGTGPSASPNDRLQAALSAAEQ